MFSIGKKRIYQVVLCFFVLCSANLHCDFFRDFEDEGLKGPVFVSLGSFCESAWVHDECKIRKAAFPFDWITSFDGEKLIEALEDDFLFFLDENYLEPYAIYFPDLIYVLVNTKYHLEFLHEGYWDPVQFTENMNKLQVKYKKRIERFRKLKEYEGKVVFVRTAYLQSAIDPYRCYKSKENIEISEKYSLRLFEALKNYFPALDFCLIIVNVHDRKEVEMEKVVVPNLVMIRANNVICGTATYDIPTKVSAYKRFYDLLVAILQS